MTDFDERLDTIKAEYAACEARGVAFSDLYARVPNDVRWLCDQLRDAQQYKEFVLAMVERAGKESPRCVHCPLGAFEWRDGCGCKCDAVFFAWQAWQAKGDKS